MPGRIQPVRLDVVAQPHTVIPQFNAAECGQVRPVG